MNIKIQIAKKHATVVDTPVIVCGNRGYSVEFIFDSEWDAAAAKTARFVYVRKGAVRYKDVVFTGNTVSVPVLSNIKEVRVGVFAGDLRTTTPARIPCELSIRCDTGVPADPTPSQYDQIMKLIRTGGATDEQVATAVDEYMIEHPDAALSDTAKTLLLAILQSAVYTADVSATINALETAWNNATVVKYSITNNLTDVTTSNSQVSVTVGEAYSATLTPYDGMKLDSVIVTMGGVNVTEKYYDGEGNINIAVVTGDIVVAASAIANSDSDWDYEWTASSGVAPVTYDGKAATGTFVDGLYKISSDYDFAEVRPIQVEIVFKAIAHYGQQSPQFSLCYSSGNGFKVFCDNTGTISTSIGGSNAATGTAFPENNTLQTFVGSASADGCSFEFAGLNKTGAGLINNQWMNATRIAVSSATVYLAELRYKYL